MEIVFSIISIPILGFLAILLLVTSKDDPNEKTKVYEWVIAGFHYVLCFLTYGLCVRGTMALLDEMGLVKDMGFFYLIIPAFCLFAFGLACWNAGRNKEKYKQEQKQKKNE